MQYFNLKYPYIFTNRIEINGHSFVLNIMFSASNLNVFTNSFKSIIKIFGDGNSNTSQIMGTLKKQLH